MISTRLWRVLIILLAVCIGACGSCEADEPVAVPEGDTPWAPRYDHVERLELELTVDGTEARALALYAEPPDYAPTPSPERDGSEGVACVDDTARATVLAIRRWAYTRDPELLARARGYFAFLRAMERGDGEVVNFVHADGSRNETAETSRKSFSYWAARTLWATGEAIATLPPEETTALEPMLDRLLDRMEAVVGAGELVGGSVTATAEALLGVLAVVEARPEDERAERLARRTAERIAQTFRDAIGAHTDAPDAPWHAWGARAVEALARAAAILDEPRFAESATREVDGLWRARFGPSEVPAVVSPPGGVERFPQIAYGVGSIVLGYLALADAAGDPRYAAKAGELSRWFLGDNAADAPVYDAETGRVYDGIDAGGELNRNAGAESAIEGLLALEAVARSPVALAAMRERDASGPVELTYWPAANPVEVALAQELAAAFEEANPDVRVRVQPIPAGRSSEEVLLAAIVGRSTPDVCSNVSGALLSRLVRADGVVRLDAVAPTAARLRERATVPMIEPFRLPDGGIYAMPWKTNPMMLLYDVDALAAAGVAPPRTHSELLAAFRALARDTDGDGRRDRWALWAPLKTTWFERFYDFYPFYLAAGGDSILDGERATFDDAPAHSAMSLLRTGFGEGLFPLANFAGRDPFVDRTVAMKVVGPWFIEELERTRVADLRYDAVPVPVPDGTDPDDARAFGDVKHIAVFATTEHPVEAARLVAFLTSPEADRRLVEMAAQLPYRRNLERDARFRAAIAGWPTLDRYASRVERARDLPLHPDVVEVMDILSEAYEAAVIYGTEPVSTALSAAESEAQEVLDASR